jgi:hypothetical protein
VEEHVNNESGHKKKAHRKRVTYIHGTIEKARFSFELNSTRGTLLIDFSKLSEVVGSVFE